MNCEDGKGEKSVMTEKEIMMLINQTKSKGQQQFLLWVLCSGKPCTSDRDQTAVVYCLKRTKIVGLDTNI